MFSLSKKTLCFKGQSPGGKKSEKVRKVRKKCENYETILHFSCCPLVFPEIWWHFQEVSEMWKGQLASWQFSHFKQWVTVSNRRLADFWSKLGELCEQLWEFALTHQEIRLKGTHCTELSLSLELGKGFGNNKCSLSSMLEPILSEIVPSVPKLSRKWFVSNFWDVNYVTAPEINSPKSPNRQEWRYENQSNPLWQLRRLKNNSKTISVMQALLYSAQD